MAGFIYTVLIVGGIGLILGALLSFAAKFFSVKSDEKVEQIRACLPGANCGACGFSGCDGYAAAIAAGQAEYNLCTPGGQGTAQELSKILGGNVTVVAKTAVVHCNHCFDKAVSDFAYCGLNSCAAANILYNGSLACKNACLGFGDCIKACEFNALKLENGNIVVDKNICGGCGKCVKACPKGVITLEVKCLPYVACSNTEKGAVARKQCTAACIGCKKCENVCEHNAITVKNNLAVIDSALCVGCNKCSAACPVGCILN